MLRKCYILFFLICTYSFASERLDDSQFNWNADTFSKLVTLAENGDVESQATLGQLYLSGEYVDKNIEKAKYWLDKASLKGDINAKINLSYLYANYLGDMDKGIELLKPLANKGDVDAMFNLAFLYEKTNRIKEAIYWYKSLFEKGDADSKFNLALLMSKQKNVNPIEVVSLLEDSLKKKSSDDAKFLLSLFYLDYEEVRNIEKGMELLTQVAEKGVALAEHKLGTIYEEGIVVPKNLQESKKWLSRARLHGYE